MGQIRALLQYAKWALLLVVLAAPLLLVPLLQAQLLHGAAVPQERLATTAGPLPAGAHVQGK